MNRQKLAESLTGGGGGGGGIRSGICGIWLWGTGGPKSYQRTYIIIILCLQTCFKLTSLGHGGWRRGKVKGAPCHTHGGHKRYHWWGHEWRRHV